jgi:isopenicillin-N N-acyltransferase-like protein
MILSVAVVLSILISFVTSQIEVHECHHPVTFNPQNNLPIADAHAAATWVATVPNGKLYTVELPQFGNNTASSFWLTHVWGSAYEVGFAQGQLHKSRVPQFLDSVWKYLETQVATAVDKTLPLPAWLLKAIADFGLDAALDLTEWATRSYTGTYFYDELAGLCAGAGLGGRGSACYQRAVRMHMLAGLTQGHCSLFGSWGAASANGHTLQLRALDWNMDGPFRDYPAVTVYHGDEINNNTFVTVGFVSFIGALTGVNSKMLGISEIGVSYPDAVSFGTQSRIGYPFIFLLRDILQFDNSVDDATNRMVNAKRTCDLILAVGDGKEAEVRGYAYSSSELFVQDDINMRPRNDTWHFHLPQMIYWGMDWLCPGYSEVLGTQLKKHHGALTGEIAIQDVISVVGSGDVHIGIYDLTAGDMWVSFASPSNTTKGVPDKAYQRQFAKFDLAKLFSEAHP